MNESFQFGNFQTNLSKTHKAHTERDREGDRGGRKKRAVMQTNEISSLLPKSFVLRLMHDAFFLVNCS